MKKGISLIVLVITIIVIIILAGAVILSLSSNNPIKQATNAKTASNQAEVQAAVTMYLAKIMAVGQDKATITGTAINATNTGSATVTAGTQINQPISFESLQIAMPTGTWTIDANGLVDDGITPLT